jgi:hypothetical protein
MATDFMTTQVGLFVAGFGTGFFSFLIVCLIADFILFVRRDMTAKRRAREFVIRLKYCVTTGT